MAKMKDVTVKVPKESIMYTNISKSQDGYNSARLVAKMGEKEYMSISYEWEGEGVPGFAIDLMGSMQAAEIKSGQVVASFEDEFKEYSAKKKGLPPWMKKDDEEDMEDDKKDKKGKKGKDDKKKAKAIKKDAMEDKGICPDCGKKKEECKCKPKAKAEKDTKPVPADTTKKHAPGVCSNCGLATEDCTCDGKKQLEKTKEKKGADKKA